MTVEEHDRIDQVAAGPDGRLLLAMVEERSYRYGGDFELTEDFRQKMNAYVHAIRSGHVRQLASDSGIPEISGVDIVLFADTTPPDSIQKMIGKVNQQWGAEGIGARWETWKPAQGEVAVVERALVTEAVEIIGGVWDFALLWAFNVGGEGAAGIQVKRYDGAQNVRPTELLLNLLAEHKRVAYDPNAGTWLAGSIAITDADTYTPDFSATEVPDWMPRPTPENLRRELELFPRTEIPSWISERISAGSPAPDPHPAARKHRLWRR
ncbi:hypothetical protein JMUB6875_14000 [Nocardia sp. JMUB6875]|uniref:hypothetical protein n=1 Tax=Nocardia sp. JMUB6875 TaxID=3158170 RepID=UPI0032E5DBA0